MLQLDRGTVAQTQGAGLRLETHVAIAGGGVGVHGGQQKLPELHHLGHDALMARMGRMDVEDKVTARRCNCVIEFDRELQSDHERPWKHCLDAKLRVIRRKK
jgi:hypothetical protein